MFFIECDKSENSTNDVSKFHTILSGKFSSLFAEGVFQYYMDIRQLVYLRARLRTYAKDSIVSSGDCIQLEAVST